MKQENRYYEAMDKIATPIPLKERVREKMIKQMARRRMIRIGYGLSALAASLFIIIGLGFLQRAPEDLILTELVANQHRQEVFLQDGELYFVFLQEDENRIGIRLAPQYPVQQTLALEEYTGVLPEEPPMGLSSEEGEVIAYFSGLGGEPQVIFGEVVYRNERGGILTIHFTDNPTFLPLPIPLEGSRIEGSRLGVGFDESANIYYGVFERNGYLLVLTGEGLEQKEFIHFLHYFMTY